jgi:hypothetical protein
VRIIGEANNPYYGLLYLVSTAGQPLGGFVIPIIYCKQAKVVSKQALLELKTSKGCFKTSNKIKIKNI